MNNTWQQHLLMKSDTNDKGGWCDGLWIQRKLSFYVGPQLISELPSASYSHSLGLNIFIHKIRIQTPHMVVVRTYIRKYIQKAQSRVSGIWYTVNKLEVSLTLWLSLLTIMTKCLTEERLVAPRRETCIFSEFLVKKISVQTFGTEGMCIVQCPLGINTAPPSTGT